MYYLELFFYYGFLTALVLTFVVFIHEMGHYLMARFLVLLLMHFLSDLGGN